MTPEAPRAELASPLLEGDTERPLRSVGPDLGPWVIAGHWVHICHSRDSRLLTRCHRGWRDAVRSLKKLGSLCLVPPFPTSRSSIFSNQSLESLEPGACGSFWFAASAADTGLLKSNLAPLPDRLFGSSEAAGEGRADPAVLGAALKGFVPPGTLMFSPAPGGASLELLPRRGGTGGPAAAVFADEVGAGAAVFGFTIGVSYTLEELVFPVGGFPCGAGAAVVEELPSPEEDDPLRAGTPAPARAASEGPLQLPRRSAADAAPSPGPAEGSGGCAPPGNGGGCTPEAPDPVPGSGGGPGAPTAPVLRRRPSIGPPEGRRPDPGPAALPPPIGGPAPGPPAPPLLNALLKNAALALGLASASTCFL